MSEIAPNKGKLGDEPAAVAAAGPEELSDRTVAFPFGFLKRLPQSVRRTKARHWNIVLTLLVLFVSVLALFVSVLTYYSNLSGRVEQRKFEAWQTLLHSAPGSYGKREALEYLNSQGEELVGIKLDAWYGEDRQTGELRGRVFLEGVELPKAKLAEGNFLGAILDRATLTGADLSGTNLYRASLIGADLNDAILQGTDLSGAELTDAVGLTQKQLDNGCGDEDTKLPDGLTIKPCQ